MLQKLNFETQTANKCLQQNSYNNLSSYLKNEFKLVRDDDGKPLQYKYSEEVLNCLVKVLDDSINKPLGDEIATFYKELFRSLRNYVINPEVQAFLTNHKQFLENTNLLILRILESDSNFNFKDSLQVILQFLINLIVSKTESAVLVSEIFGGSIFKVLEARICVYETSALIYNVHLHKSLDDLMSDCNYYVLIFELYEEDNSAEFLHFLLENFIKSAKFWANYKILDLKHRITLLEILRHKQTEGHKINLPEACLKTLTKLFIDSSTIIFQTVTNTEPDLEAFEVSLLLETLSSLCSDENHLKILQTDKDFLINSGVLLINIHRLGKQSENYFTSIQKLSEIREPTDVIRQHPAFGFKVGLIRIIGNLCWRSRTMQDLVREAELIPVILDCCNIDARNPLIMQWVILAVRNLCDGNLKNQELIAGMHKQGTVSSAALEEMGLTLHSDGDNSVKIVSLDAIKKS